jgi:peptidase inhibitor family I36
MASICGLALAVALAHACRDTLPAAPSELTAGIVIYEDANFLGKSALITADIRNLRDIDGPCRKDDGDSVTNSWDDCASSVRVAPGWRATLYEDPDFRGWAADVGEENVSNYQLVRGPCARQAFNDCASSIRVFRK